MATATKLKFTEFTDLLLARLYDKDREKPGELFDLNAIAKEISEEVPETWVVDAAQVLQSRRLAECLITYGAARAQLTGEGRAFVEEEKGTGIIAKYHQSRTVFVNSVNITGDNNQTIVGRDQKDLAQSQTSVEKEREPVFRILGEIERKLSEDASLTAADRSQFLEDVKYIREQLKRREPNRPALASILAPLSHVSSVASSVVSLIRLLNS